MDNLEIAVLAGGIALSLLVLWYFFGEREGVRAHLSEGGLQEINITVKGGYSPDVVVVRQGEPVRLNFFRDEKSSCSERVIISDLGIARDLPAFSTTSIEFTPERDGEFNFTCGMNMLHGTLIVEPRNR